MEIKELLNKEKEVMTTLEGVKMVEYKFAEGDSFVPQLNKVSVIKAKNENAYDSYSLLCRIKNKAGVVETNLNGEENIFITLTPAQVKSINKIKEDHDLTQELFQAYTYRSEEYKKDCIGVGLKREFAKPKSFEDFEEVKVEA